MATFTGTDANETITPEFVSATVTRNPPGSVPGDAGDTLQGGGGNDTLDGGAGPDFIWGGSGDDWLFGGDSNDGLQGDEGNDTLYGGAGYNSLFGSAGNDVLVGGDFGNWLEGGPGADAMTGGAATDQIFVDDVGDIVIAGGGTDWLYVNVSYTLAADAENLFLGQRGATDLIGIGNDAANTIDIFDGSSAYRGTAYGMGGNDTLSGSHGDDILDGGDGADIMAGGFGNDRYFIDDVGDVVNESNSDGEDSIFATVSYTLSAGVEKLILAGPFGIDGVGNDLDNLIQGNDGSNALNGLGGGTTR
jgi:Ca2+-binding RTX toxin-like protein